MLNVTDGVWKGEIVITTGPAEDGRYPVAKFAYGRDGVATFVQLSSRIPDGSLRRVERSYLEDFKKAYDFVSIAARENPLMHELEIA